MKIISGCSSKRGTTIKEDVERANPMNEFFSSHYHSHLRALHPPPDLFPSLSLSKRANTSTERLLPPTITAAPGSREMRSLHPCKAGGVSPLLLKAYVLELRNSLQRILKLRLEYGRVPKLLKTSCITPVRKVSHQVELNDFRLIALSHVK